MRHIGDVTPSHVVKSTTQGRKRRTRRVLECRPVHHHIQNRASAGSPSDHKLLVATILGTPAIIRLPPWFGTIGTNATRTISAQGSSSPAAAQNKSGDGTPGSRPPEFRPSDNQKRHRGRSRRDRVRVKSSLLQHGACCFVVGLVLRGVWSTHPTRLSSTMMMEPWTITFELRCWLWEGKSTSSSFMINARSSVRMIASLGYSVLLLVLLIMFRIQYFFEKTRPKMKKYASFRGRRSSWGLPANRLWTLKLRFGIFPFFTSSETIIRNKTKSFNIPYPTANNTPNYTMFPSYQTVPLANAPKEEPSSIPVPRMKKVAVAAMVGTAFVLGFSASGGALEGGANLSGSSILRVEPRRRAKCASAA